MIPISWFSHRDPLGRLAGGAERSIREICTGLARHGFKVTVYAAADRIGYPRMESTEFNTELFPTWLGPHLKKTAMGLSSVPANLEVHDLAHVVPWNGPRLHRRGSRPTLAYFRHLHARTLDAQVKPVVACFLKALERLYPLLYADTPFITESESSVSDLVSLGIPRAQVNCIPPGVNTDVFRVGTRSDTPDIVYFGGLRQYKRPRLLIPLLEGIRANGVPARLTVIGDGPELPRLIQLANVSECKQYIRFAGRIDDLTLADIVSRAWINVHLSVSEGWCLSVMEASASGVPTIAFDVPGLTDSIKRGLNGSVVPDGDLERLIFEACAMLRDPTKLRESAREWAERFRWGTTIKRWVELLTELGARSAT